jgi:hypothetical protein
MKKWFFGLLLVPVFSWAQCFGPGSCNVCPEGQTYNDCSAAQFGPGGCVPGCQVVPSVIPENPPIVVPVVPQELCLPKGCSTITYFWVGAKVVAESRLPNGYEVLGWSGPCPSDDRSQCPDIFNQAFADLRMNALRANRAQLFK